MRSLWTSKAHAYHQPICQKLSWLHHWSIPHVHSSRTFSPPGWGPGLQCQALQVAQWTWWWQCLVVLHCRSAWSLLCHLAADTGGLALLMAKFHWHGALPSAHKSYTHSHMSWKRGGKKTELVAASWTSSRQFSHVLWSMCWVYHKKSRSPLLYIKLTRYICKYIIMLKQHNINLSHVMMLK